MKKTMKPQEFKNKMTILGVKIDDQPIEWIMNRIDHFLNSENNHKIFTPNPEICLRAGNDEHYRKLLNTADINTPDGIGLKLGAKILRQELKNRVTGADLTKAILEKYKSQNISVFIVIKSNSLSTESDIKKLFKENYPQIKVKVGVVDKDDCLNCDKVLNDINDFNPQILFIALGAPDQEIWINKYSNILTSVRASLGVGGSFDFLTGKMKRAPEIIRKLGAEWLYRLYREPKRLMRIKHATADFLILCHQWEKRMDNEFRINVLGIIKNKEGKYLIQKNARLKEHWQFPQGGVDEGERPEMAVVRETAEELGAEERLFKVIKKIPDGHEYVWPRYAQLLRGYKGQTQTAFVLEFNGNDSDFHPEKSDEVVAIKWVGKTEILKNLHPVRREFAKKLIRYL